MTVTMMVLAAFAVGVIFGLTFGPSKERLEAAAAEAFMRGYDAAQEHKKVAPP